MSKNRTGYILQDEFDLFASMFDRDGVTHISIFRGNPATSEIASELKRVGLHYRKVKVTIEEGK